VSKAKKIGIMFIVLGLFIPLIFYPYTELKEELEKKAIQDTVLAA
jgi:hypothetical protein